LLRAAAAAVLPALLVAARWHRQHCEALP
jgi:hypothetical protein